MSNLAQEEADRFFNYRPTATSHPEDAGNEDPVLEGDDGPSRRGIKSSRKPEPEDQDTDDEDDVHQHTSSLSGTKQSYTVPTTAQYANTGPKGVIADAQNYHRSKHNKPQQTQQYTSNTHSAPHQPTNGNTSDSDLDLLDDDDTDPFMQAWRQKRLTELQEQYTVISPSTTSTNTPNRTWGTLEHVNATGYLDAIENTPPTTNVVVFLFDPLNADSLEVEDELKMLAYSWVKTRFVKMHHKIAEMQSIEIPAVLVYRRGDVSVTMSGVGAEGLEGVLKRQGVLVK